MVSPTAATFYFYKSFWSMLRRSQALETPQLGFRELNGRKSSWTWPSSAPKPPRPGTFSGNLLRNPVERDLALHQRTWLNLTRRLHQCTPELFWAEDPISLRWGKTNQVLKSIFSTDLRGIHQQNSVFSAFPGQYINLEVFKTLCHHWWVVSVWCGWGKGSF